MQKRRPTGVAIMAVLEGVVGLFWLSGGLLALLMLVGANPYGVAGFAGLGILSFAIGLLGTVLLLLGLVSLGVGIGMWTGKGWALTFGRVFSGVGVLIGLFLVLFGDTGSVVGLLINLLVLYYLTRPEVKAFFGKGAQGIPATGTAPTQ